MGNPLLDKDFLKELDLHRNKIIYARLTSLDFDEKPISYIEGRVTGGSISVDGTSVVRRTCNLTLISENVDINEFYWGLNTKIILEIGLQNTINNKYPDVIWFKQGIFVITTFNTSIGTNQATITVGGKDKGCLINGDIAGNLTASVDFGSIDDVDYDYEPVTLEKNKYKAYTYYLYDSNTKTYSLDIGEYVDDDNFPAFGFNPKAQYYQQHILIQNTKLKLYNIIREAVHVYAKEPYHNIIISDLDNYGLELLQYYGDKDIYLLRAEDTHNFEHICLNENQACYLQNSDPTGPSFPISHFKNGSDDSSYPVVTADSRVDDWSNVATTIYFYPTKVIVDDGNGNFHKEDAFTKGYTVSVLTGGETTGYKMTDLVYNGDLIANIGDTLSSILDKIKNMLGDFEYFYDIDGHFIFQRKKTFINVSWNNLIVSDNERFAQSLAETSAVTYNFEGNILLTAVQQSPVLNNLKNDYSIWGIRKGINGGEIPIHMRYAIHKKPSYYRAFDGKVYCTDAEFAKAVLTKTYTTIITHHVSPLADFEMQYANEMPPNLTPPVKKANGVYLPGWWDIRDWARYYKLVMHTNDDPAFTMKWYSFNSPEGCVPIASLNVENVPSWYKNSYCWLVVVTSRERNGQIEYRWDFAHGSGSPSGTAYPCTKWESHWDDQDPTKLISNPVEPRETELFIPPFSACSDNHTYLYFLNYDVAANRNVYFYNPKFPGIDDLEDYIEQQIVEEYQEFIDESLINVVDWREIIYQMAVDYYRYNETPTDPEKIDLYNANGWDLNKTGDNFLISLIENNKLADGDYAYPSGYTGYEQYYADMLGFWRQLYCPLYDEGNLNLRYNMKDGNYQMKRTYIENSDHYTEENTFIYPSVESFTSNFYLPESYKETVDNTIATMGYVPVDNLKEANEFNGWSDETAAADCNYASYFNDQYAPWARNVIDDPAALNFWIDFLDTGELGQFDVTAVGDRQKVVNDNDVRSIYNKEVPDIIFVDSKENFSTIDKKTGYTYCKLNSALDNLFITSSLGKSAKELLDELLYQFSYCIENITLTSIPIYYLQPNTRIFVHDDKTKIDGDYIVTKFTIPLTTSGTMSITANKAPQRIY